MWKMLVIFYRVHYADTVHVLINTTLPQSHVNSAELGLLCGRLYLFTLKLTEKRNKNLNMDKNIL